MHIEIPQYTSKIVKTTDFSWRNKIVPGKRKELSDQKREFFSVGWGINGEQYM